MKKLGFVLLFILGSFSVFSQTETDIQLAQHYYSNGEFDKATGYYEKIYNATPTKVYFNRYLECLVQIKDFKTAEKITDRYLSLINEEWCWREEELNKIFKKAIQIENENKIKKSA